MAVASSGRWQSRAALDAALKFSPQRSALRESALEARENYANTVGAAKAAATLTQRATMAAKPQIQQIYAGAGAAQQAGTTLVSQALAQLGAGADPFKAAGATESAQQLANLGAASARDQAMLHQQGVAARAGAQFAQTNAQATLQKAIRAIFSKNQSLGAEQGAFAASEAENLAHEAEKLEQSERQSQRTAATSRANAVEGNAQQERGSQRTAQTAREKAAAKGTKPYLQSPDKQQQAASRIDTLKALAEAGFKEGHNRGQVLSELTTDRPSLKLGTGGTLPGRKGYAPDVLMSAALDVAEFGGVSQHTLQRLHERGYSVQHIGVPVLPKGKDPKAAALYTGASRALAPLR